MNNRIDELIGQTIQEIDLSSDRERIEFKTDQGKHYVMYHMQDCCESVYIEDIVGDLEDLINSPMLEAREDIHSRSSDNPYNEEFYQKFYDSEDDFIIGKLNNFSNIDLPIIDESSTWTFYNLRTLKGSVTIRWFGSSNGYYSESVDFVLKGEDW